MELAEKRAEAKKAKDFALADSIRDQITALGYSIKDTPKGPQLEKIK
jgi:cysteinyl-tRNA synthetase